MILKYISTNEFNLSKGLKDGWNKINQLSNFDKYITIFWLLGPFIYLIERDPADLWLTSIGIVFLGRCFKKKDWGWAFQNWFKCALILWIFGLFSALMGPDPFYSFQQGFVWARFPLYVAAAQVWLAKDRDIRIVMLVSMLFGAIIMCCILISETIIEPKIRLIWPYGDTVPGGYVAKFSLPAICTIMAIAVSKKSKVVLFYGLLVFITIFSTALTGERTHFLILIFSCIIAGLIWKPNFTIYGLIIVIQIFIISTAAFKRPDLLNRYSETFISQIPILNMENNDYWGAWRGGIQQGISTPFFGIGPSGTRLTCHDLKPNIPKWLPGSNYCGNHPHNFYVQLFAETGVFGLLIGLTLFSYIIYTCYLARKNNANCPMSATSFVVPIAFFFPLQQFGSFYGQWGNLFFWFAIGFAVSQYQGWSKFKNYSSK